MDPWASPWGDGQEEVPSRPELRAQDLTNTQSSQTSPPTEAKEEGTTADALSADPWGGALPAPPGEPDGGGGADVWGATGSTVPETQKVKADADSAETSSVSEPAASTWAGERNAASSPDEAKRTPTAETTVPLPVSSAGFGSTSPVATRANFDPWGSGASADPLPSPSKSKGASTSGTKDSVTLSASPWGSGETESRNAEPVHARPISVEANPALGLGSGADGLSASLAAGEDGGWGGSMSDIGGWASTGTALGIAELGQEGQGEEGEGAADDVWGAEARQRAEQSKSMVSVNAGIYDGL